MKLFKKQIFLFIVPFLIVFLYATPTFTATDDSYKLTDEEIKALNLSDSEAAELKQFVDALNKLPPEKKAELEEATKKTEAAMREAQLDPTNLDDLFKFMEQQGPQGGLKKPAEPPMRMPTMQQPRPAPMPSFDQPTFMQEKPVQASAANPAATLSMLKEINKHLAALRQKVNTRASLINKMERLQREVGEFQFYLNVLQSPDLINLLATTEFGRLHKNLSTLHRSLLTYEPSVIARKKATIVDENDPYEVLDIPYTVTAEQLTARFKELEASKGPKAIDSLLKKRKCKADECKKIKKEALRTFNLIKQSYTELKSPKSRKQIDAILQKKIEKETRNERSSIRAFDTILNSFSMALSSGLLRDVQQVIEKNRPQEAAQLRNQLELERRIYERSKQKIVVPQLPARMGYEPGPYDAFYQKMAQESYSRPQYPTRSDTPSTPNGQGAQLNGQGNAAGNGTSGTKPKSGGGSGTTGGGDDKTKDKSKKTDKNGSKGSNTRSNKEDSLVRSKDMEKFASLSEIETLLKDAGKRKNTITVNPPLRSQSGADAASQPREQVGEERTLDQILADVDTELINPADTKPEAPQYLKQFFDKNNLERLGGLLHEFSGVVKSIKPKDTQVKAALGEYWNKKVSKHSDMIDEWRHKIARILDTGYRSSNNPVKNINQVKRRRHNLDAPSVNPYDEDGKSTGKGPEAGAHDLAHLRDVTQSISHSFKEITTLLKQKSSGSVKQEKKAEDAE